MSNASATATANMEHSSPLVCYAPTMISIGGLWRGENPLDYSFPLFLFQLLLVVLTTRTTGIILQPLRQPRYLAEIVGGLMLGPQVLGRIPNFGNIIFPKRSILILETMANIGLIYFMFIVGVEIDRSVVRNSNQSLSFAAACVGIPFVVCTLAAVIIPPPQHHAIRNHWAFLIFLGITLTITAFSVLARRLAELKLVNTAIGNIALTTAIIVDSFAWGLLALAITLVQNEEKLTGTLFTLVSGIVSYGVITVGGKMLVKRILNKTPEGEEVDDFYACLILVLVLVSSVVSDAIGIHAISGAFMFGLVIPNGPLGEALIERIEDFVEGLLLPLFFATSGLKMDFAAITDSGAAVFMLAMVVVGTVTKVAGCVVVARIHSMTLREGVAMGLLMNTKGVIEMVLLNIGKDRKLLTDEAFSTLVVLSVAISAITNPLLHYIIRPTHRAAFYNRRTIQCSKPDAELRLVLCVHSARHVPSILALLNATCPTKQCPVTVYALHLIELTSRASAMMILNVATKDVSSSSRDLGGDKGSNPFSSSARGGLPNLRWSSHSHSDHIMHAFESYEQHNAGVSISPLSAVSSYASMHCDVCDVAEETHAALIILPFHKQQTVDGGMEPANPAIRTLNQNVLSTAPCSVGILVDRGLRTAGGFTGSGVSSTTIAATKHHVVVLFIGGPDDREAIAIATRMAEHPGISLTIVRFIAVDNSPKAQRVVEMAYDEQAELEEQRDNDCIGDFRLQFTSYTSVRYIERAVGNSEEMVSAIRATFDEGSTDLCIVGRGADTESKLTKGMTEWSECPELGTIGDLLASADFGATMTVLAVQQWREQKAKEVDTMMDSNSDGIKK